MPLLGLGGEQGKAAWLVLQLVAPARALCNCRSACERRERTASTSPCSSSSNSLRAAAPFAFDAVASSRDHTFTTHGLSPGALLATYVDAYEEPPPPVFVLAIRGERFELGEPVGAAAAENLRQALAFYRRLLAEPVAAAWQRLAGS